MRESLVLLLCFVGLAVAHHDARADDPAKIAERERVLALLRLSAPPAIAEPTQPQRPKHDPPCIAELPAARAKANAENRPLLIWVGGCETVDKTVRGAFPDAVHCHCDTINGSAEHRLLIPIRGEAAYAVFDSEKLTKADIGDIRRVLERAPSKTSASVLAPAPGDCQDGTCAVPQAAPQAFYKLAPQQYYQPAYSGLSAAQCTTGR